MNTILANLKSRSLTSVFALWSAWIALHAAGTTIPDWFVISATLGVCFKEGLGKLSKNAEKSGP